jgi:hypothetical protein
MIESSIGGENMSEKLVNFVCVICHNAFQKRVEFAFGWVFDLPTCPRCGSTDVAYWRA